MSEVTTRYEIDHVQEWRVLLNLTDKETGEDLSQVVALTNPPYQEELWVHTTDDLLFVGYAVIELGGLLGWAERCVEVFTRPQIIKTPGLKRAAVYYSVDLIPGRITDPFVEIMKEYR